MECVAYTIMREMFGYLITLATLVNVSL